jgi:type IV secretion system protein VirB1
MIQLKLDGTLIREKELSRVAACERGAARRDLPKKAPFPNLGGLCAAVFLAALSTQVSASPLPKALFDRLATTCAPGIQLPTLRAVAAVESQFEPWAIRDNTSHQTWSPPTLANAVALAGERLKMGHSVDVGLMQINSRNMASLGMTLNDAFDACRSMDAAGRILFSAYAAGSSELDRQAAILIAFSRYNTGRPLAGIANGYAGRVIMEQRSPSVGTPVSVEMPETQQTWNVWATAGSQTESWLITAKLSSNFERAGAQTTNARVEERAAVPPLAKGEPYELLAYQESAPPKP